MLFMTLEKSVFLNILCYTTVKGVDIHHTTLSVNTGYYYLVSRMYYFSSTLVFNLLVSSRPLKISNAYEDLYVANLS